MYLKLLLPEAFFRLKCTKYHWEAGLRPDPLGSFQRCPRPPSWIKGSLLLRERAREGSGGRREREGRE